MLGASFLVLVAVSFADRTIKINRVCDTQTELKLTTIVQKSDETIANFVFSNKGDQPQEIYTPPPGHKEAFYFIDAKSKRKYELLDVHRIAIKPNKTRVAGKSTFSFSLSFERISDSSSRVHLIEGEIEPTDGSSSWRWMGINLK